MRIIAILEGSAEDENCGSISAAADDRDVEANPDNIEEIKEKSQGEWRPQNIKMEECDFPRPCRGLIDGARGGPGYDRKFRAKKSASRDNSRRNDTVIIHRKENNGSQ
jgi:hypothetical protein